MKKIPLVYIIVLNYNGHRDTIRCIKSLNCISYSNFRIVIVDNLSTDNSRDKIISYLKNYKIKFNFYNSPELAIKSKNKKHIISIIQSQFNGGYGFGNNIGLKHSIENNADYMLIINNDTIVEPEFLEPMVNSCENNQNIGIASGKICYLNAPDIIWFNGGKFTPTLAKVVHYDYNEKNIGQTSIKPISFITGCMWLLPRKIVKEVGLINEEYFMYLEDLEYCQRVLNKGFTLKVFSESIIYHKVGSTTGGKHSSLSVFYRTKNMNKYLLNYIVLPSKIIAIIMFNMSTIIQIIKSTKLFLLKDYCQAILSLIREDSAS